jgi:hypothetical protein
MKRTSLIITAALVAGLALGVGFGPSVAGNASAQTPSASASTSTSTSPISTLRDLFLDNLAEALGIDRTALDSAIVTAGNTTADEAVANGTLTPQQGDALKERVQSGDFGFLGGRGGPGRHGGPGGHGGGVRIPGVKDAIVAAAAQTLNLTEDELVTQLRGGQTLAQIAEAQGTTEQAVVDAALAAAKTELDAAVANGTVTQAQADAVYTQLQERGANLFFGGRGGRGRHHEHNGENVPSTPSASPSASAGADA